MKATKRKTVKCTCAHCGVEIEKQIGHYNRAVSLGRRLYCGRVCFGLDRRVEKSQEQRKLEKRLYDMSYREKNAEALKASHAAYYEEWKKRSGSREKEKARREASKDRHAEYCRSERYKAWKKKYDRRYRATKLYGEFGEALLVLQDLENAIAVRATKEELAQAKGTVNKKQTRRREYERSECG